MPPEETLDMDPVVETAVPQAEPATDVAAELAATKAALEKEKADRNADLGRLQKEREEKQRILEAARAYNVPVDDSGNAAYNPATQQQQQFTPEPTPTEFNWEDPAAEVDRRVEAGLNRVLGQLIPNFVGLIDQGARQVMELTVPDFKDIKPDVDEALRDMGFRNMTELRARDQSGKLEQLVLNAARGKRAMANPAPTPTPVAPTPDPAVVAQAQQVRQAEADRQDRLASVSTGTASASPSAGTNPLNAEQEAHRQQIGYTVEQYLEALEPQTVIDVHTDTTRGKHNA
jgi:hypothetical protein